MGDNFIITIRCQGHTGCKTQHNYRKTQNLFFTRAYGPSVISGIILPSQQQQSNGSNDDHTDYMVQFRFLDPGIYTVEVVITFSNTVSFDRYPLRENEDEEPNYEGYMLPEFPLQVQVVGSGDGSQVSSPTPTTIDRLCSFSELTEQSSSSDALSKARWKVKSKSNMQVDEKYATSSTIDLPISSDGYKRNIHSTGIQMTYEYTNCTLISKSAFSKRQGNNNPFYQCATNNRRSGGGSSSVSDNGGGHRQLQESNTKKTKTKQQLIVIFIGDSVMRIQKNMFDGYLKNIDSDIITIKTIMIELYTGYRRCEKLVGPNVQKSLQDIKKEYNIGDGPANKDSSTKVAILFNTGLHDIHRLCGQEFTKDRLEYLPTNDDAKRVDLIKGTFKCIDEYKSILQDFTKIIEEFPAKLRVFQSTTAGWPKYGNYNIEWPTHRGQNLPLSPDIVSYYNEFSYNVLLEKQRGLSQHINNDDNHQDGIHIMDGYWITYSRPDNREIGDIGHKLSHPGLEVQSAMVRIWIMLLLEKVCSLSPADPPT